jgi:hypothetical protein
MTAERNANSLKRNVRLAKHLAAAIVTAIPVLLMVYITVINPGFYAHLFSSDSKVMGFSVGIIFIMLLLLGLLYGCVILIANTIIALAKEPKSRGKSFWGLLKIAILGVGLYFLLRFAIIWTVMGPAGLILFQSPVGRMFFGG